MRKFVAVFIGLFVASLAFAQPVSATPPHYPAPVCPDWKLRSILNEWQDPAEGSKVYSPDKVVLTKPAGGGTEFATFDAGLEFDSPVTITVKYALNGGADFSAGAVRLFYYEEANADTLTTAPKAFVAADKNLGVLTISNVDKVGTLGVVYDASNAAAGKVTFWDMRVGKTKVKFTDVCPDETTSPSPSPTPSVTTPAPTTAPPTTESPLPSISPTLVAGPQLPVTGSPTTLLFGIGALLFVAGVVGIVLARRRRQRFES